MCGIVGFLNPKGFSSDRTESVAANMANVLSHRGPDDSGVWLERKAGIALAFRRLAIIDLSLSGHQPMLSHSGRYVLIFNGEIYNHRELQAELIDEGWNNAWRGHSDTEILLSAIEFWGVDKVIPKTVGMFAIALWDRQEEILYLVRDRIGEKPLYYGWNNGVFFFTSELQALKQYPGFAVNINRQAIASLLQYGYIPAPLSIYQNIYKLIPGCILKLSSHMDTLPDPQPYWSFPAVTKNTKTFKGSEEDAVKSLEALLSASIQQQMIADVPIGTFLSGGIDSTAIVSLAQACSMQPVKTFSIGFHEKQYNEAQYAREIAVHLRTDHTELYMTDQDALDIIPNLPTLYSEPFSDSSQLPTFLLSQMTRQHVTVALSGDGGDELFGGYKRYLFMHHNRKLLYSTPLLIRNIVASISTLLSPGQLNLLYNQFQFLLPKRFRIHRFGEKVHKFAIPMKATNLQGLYMTILSRWLNISELVINHNEDAVPPVLKQLVPSSRLDFQHLMDIDTLMYLPDDILTKVDRAAMGVSLETRIPFLDHRIVEFARSLPADMKIRDTQGKWILRQVVNKYVPGKLFERPKQGFSVPISGWLRGTLRDWAENLLNPLRIQQEGFLHHIPIHRIWGEHLSGKIDRSNLLWGILMFQAWLEEEGRN